MKYRNLQLVSTKDSGYRAFGAQRRLENMKFRKKKERFTVLDGGRDDDDTAGPPLWGGKGGGPTIH